MSEKSSVKSWVERAPERDPQGEQFGSGSALLQTMSEMPLVLDALLGLVRAGGFGERDVLGIRIALEEVIRHTFKVQFAREGHRLRLRYHLGSDGLLLELEDEKEPLSFDRFGERSLELLRRFMTEVRFQEQGRSILLYKRRSA